MQGNLYIALILIVAMLFIPGAIEDFRKREVDDVFIFMPYISYIITYALFGVIIVAAGLFMATIIAIASYLLYRYNYIAIGDLLGLPAIFSAIYALNFIAIFISLITAFDLYRVYIKKKGFKVKRNNIEMHEKNFWLPVKEKQMKTSKEPRENDKKTESYEYGVPLLGYAFLACFFSLIAYAATVFFV